MKSAILYAVGALCLAASGAGAVSITNGSFETGPVVLAQGFTTLSAGDTSITGWTVGGPVGVDYIGSYWVAEDGTHSIDVAGSGDGSLSQSIATNAGYRYQVTFWLAANPDGPPPTKILDVDTGGPATAYTFPIGSNTKTSMGWTQETYDFTATSATTVLTFASDVQSNYGPALDNVSISVVPEPATWALMIGGLGMVGYGLRRRATKSALA